MEYLDKNVRLNEIASRRKLKKQKKAELEQAQKDCKIFSALINDKGHESYKRILEEELETIKTLRKDLIYTNTNEYSLLSPFYDGQILMLEKIIGAPEKNFEYLRQLTEKIKELDKDE